MGSVAYQKGTKYCGAFVRSSRAAVRYVLNLDLEDSMLFSITIKTCQLHLYGKIRFLLGRTCCFELFQELVVLAAQTSPFGKLILAASCVEVLSDFQVLSL